MALYLAGMGMEHAAGSSVPQPEERPRYDTSKCGPVVVGHGPCGHRPTGERKERA